VEKFGLPAPSSEAGFRLKYPPKTLREAWNLSNSKDTARLLTRSETIATGPRGYTRMPDWSLPFPNGQLSALSAMGCYAKNIKRFADRFGTSSLAFIETKRLSTDVDGVVRQLSSFLSISPVIPSRLETAASSDLDAGQTKGLGAEKEPVRLNTVARAATSADAADVRKLKLEMARYYAPWNSKLETITGLSLGWNSLPLYTEALCQSAP